MRLEKYCNETASHKARTAASDIEGQPVYATAATIACRKEASGKIIKDLAGREIKATSRYFTVTQVSEGDLLDNKKVITAEQYKGRNGTIEGYEVYV